MKLTPMMAQYMEVKNRYKEHILFYRLGDFYEMFFDDALTASRELEITLTGRNCGGEEKAPMCGVPYHAAEGYIAKLIEKGYTVAICEQTEDASEAKGIVARDVVKVITPGTFVADSGQKTKENNYLMSIYAQEEGAALAYGDISTGEIKVVEFSKENMDVLIFDEISKIMPTEILINDDWLNQGLIEAVEQELSILMVRQDEKNYAHEASYKACTTHFNLISLDSLGLEDKPFAIKSLAGLLNYILFTNKQALSHFKNLTVYTTDTHMNLNKNTIKHLELLENGYDGSSAHTLVSVLDKTGSAAGSRLLKQWVKSPLNQKEPIIKRLDGVEALVEDPFLSNNLMVFLKKIYDFERLCGKIASKTANGKDLLALKASLNILPDIKACLNEGNAPLLMELGEGMSCFESLYFDLEKAIDEDPPYTLKEGGLIKSGFSSDLDTLKDGIKDAKLWIANLEKIEREKTGIKNLKVGFNKVFGYYLEVTKSYYDLIPEYFIRKQTLANCERFITEELKEKESLVLNAEVKINKLEYEIFNEVREAVEPYIPELQKTAEKIATADVLNGFATVSRQFNYVKPKVTEGDKIEIINGRHPVVENTIREGVFVPNDLYIDQEKSMLLITGPNMAGKSTYMRQGALLVLMAQIGCFVSADQAEIGVVDRIFTRIGASDNLSQGQSTFYVEMSELAYILNQATKNSLIILDEIGRGTSTYDGLSIAWATVKYLCKPKANIKTLFATHYHELTVLEKKMEVVKNLNVEVTDVNGEVVFLHKIIEGYASKSYGIHVAKIAGVPDAVLKESNRILKEFEKIKDPTIEWADQSDIKEDTNQLSFTVPEQHPVIDTLKTLDLSHMTPIEALVTLEKLKQQL